ncbi:PD-(D/E)XK nuclease family protein [Nocardioides sp. zg-536]|uniref:PD-(D/E)XK nuclease family protein n=1 Tax=Nocardioides faecalis TaxID=2803858 RepID=A0A938Y6D1_9ACTN|nr:PD-(D/E)XK nuclease family protein [Nocardioides faecalis]MBM9459053.1 PD-(D/E)XK nuclease family protein [Nocardioides faecalis]MBS4753845.1 PD-(D/E)XK nuclease family protein [Nocardioides faecalis]QVI57318.1 PD-(D/E)XK nuclease family protein [Nocardioides faecalis]
MSSIEAPAGTPGIAPADPAEQAERAGRAVDGVEVLGALSPSRVADFLGCALYYRLRNIDRLPEPPSPAAVRGTVVHRALELLFDLPAGRRTPEQAQELVVPAWEELQELEPALASMFAAEGPDVVTWLASCRDVLATYFDLEDPTRLEPAEREVYVETLTDAKLLLRGVVDRLDVAPDGAIRVVDYKTGSSPREQFEAKALFQLKFYALVLWRMRGTIPAVLRLVYLGNGEVLEYSPDETELLATERKVHAVWEAIRAATQAQDFQPRPGATCRWCAHQALCPAYGGTPPPYPAAPSPAAAPVSA